MAHEQIERWMQPAFLHAVAIQAADATLKSAYMAQQFGWVPELSEHPENGARPQPDGMLNVLQDVYQPQGEGEPPWPLEEFQSVARSGYAVQTNVGEEGLTAEFPFYGDEPAMLTSARGAGPQTAMLMVRKNQPHPMLGNGLLMGLTLPVDGEGAETANRLNLLEATGESDCHLLGSWCVGQMGLAFATFIPYACYMPGLLDILFQRKQ